jgi:hypothetical protein
MLSIQYYHGSNWFQSANGIVREIPPPAVKTCYISGHGRKLSFCRTSIIVDYTPYEKRGITPLDWQRILGTYIELKQFASAKELPECMGFLQCLYDWGR